MNQPRRASLALVHPCAVCKCPEQGARIVAREMMLGLREEFEYFECGGCGCVQLVRPPEDLSRYYPPDYYAFRPRPEGVLTRRLKRARLAHLFGRRLVPGGLLAWLYGIPLDLAAIARADARFDDAILDVGCGDGRLLRSLADAGFTRLTGVDPYIPADLEYPGGVVIRKQSLFEVEGLYDWVMFHHSFEHMPEPRATLQQAHRLLRPGGGALIRIPVADSHAWRVYREHWVQLDAPRHLFLHTRRSMQRLADATGFEIESVTYDSTAFQFWGSEMYRQDLPLRSDGAAEPKPGLFSAAELRRFTAEAEALNRCQEGDQACFLLRKVTDGPAAGDEPAGHVDRGADPA